MGFFNRSKKPNNNAKVKTAPASKAPARVAKTIKGTAKQTVKPNTGRTVPERKVSAKQTVKPSKTAARLKPRTGLAKPANKTTVPPGMANKMAKTRTKTQALQNAKPNTGAMISGRKVLAKETAKPGKSATEVKSRSSLTKPADKNISKRYPNGRTLKTKDTYLPNKGASLPEPKDRRVAVIDSNRKDELAVVRLTSKKQPNTTEIPGYGQGDIKTRYKHFVETKDNAGKPIKVDNKKFVENPRKSDLSKREVEKVKKKVLEHVPQAEENRKKIKELKKKR